jgi:hypothetical protein
MKLPLVPKKSIRKCSVNVGDVFSNLESGSMYNADGEDLLFSLSKVKSDEVIID